MYIEIEKEKELDLMQGENRMIWEKPWNWKQESEMGSWAPDSDYYQLHMLSLQVARPTFLAILCTHNLCLSIFFPPANGESQNTCLFPALFLSFEKKRIRRVEGKVRKGLVFFTF